MDHRFLILGLLLAGCTGADVTGSAQAIVDGTLSADEAVVALLEWEPACEASPSVGCSGVLVSPRVVLTAAHCVDPLLDAHQASVFIGADVSGPGTQIAVVAHRIDPSFDLARGDNDLALLLLAEAAPVTPVALVDHDASTLEFGGDLRVVGFGVTEARTDTEGTRLGGVMSLIALDAFNLESGPSPSMSCAGDSGGPVFASVDGAEVLVAITSAGDRACTVSARNARIDGRLDAFIRPAIAELEAMVPPAPPDLSRLAGLCSERCTTPDECPDGMSCAVAIDGSSYCSLDSIGPGAIEEACATDRVCGDRACVRFTAPTGCRCFDPCVQAPDAGAPGADAGIPGESSGCAVSRHGEVSFAWLFAAACLVRLRRSSRGRRS